MSKFTKGPWKLRGNNIGVSDVSETQSYGMLINIASVDEFDIASDWQANANLIAAAPDMYEALEGLLNVISETRGEPARDAQKKAIEALLKAEGAPF